MVDREFLSDENEDKVIATIFSTPLVAKGLSWIPLIQLLAWPLMGWLAKRRMPSRSWPESLGIGALTSSAALAAEWGHNLAHAAAARLVGKPMDRIRVIMGMPRVVYDEINDLSVAPREHILRALGGPLFNLILLPLALLFKHSTKPDTTAREVANTAVAANAFIPAVGLLPIPGLDGGPILKWSLVERGQTVSEADLTVRKVNGAVGAALTIGGAAAVKKRRRLAAGLLLLLGGTALGYASGLIKEQG